MTRIPLIGPILFCAGLVTSNVFAQDRHSMYPFEETEYEPAQFSYGVGPDTGAHLFNRPAQLGETQWAEIAPFLNPATPHAGPNTTVFFPFDSSAPINPEALRTIPGLLESKILLTGRTDPVGTDAHNDALSKRRAESVSALLVQLGVPRSNIEIQALGARSPLGEVSTQEGKAFNRQVLIHLQGKN